MISELSLNTKDWTMIFKELVKLEPRLGGLRDEAIKFMTNSPGPWHKRTKYWYHTLKLRFKHLVGFLAENQELGSCEAYDIGYQELCVILKV